LSGQICQNYEQVVKNVKILNFVILYRDCITNEHWYVRFVLMADHFICLRSWIVTMCDI